MLGHFLQGWDTKGWFTPLATGDVDPRRPKCPRRPKKTAAKGKMVPSNVCCIIILFKEMEFEVYHGVSLLHLMMTNMENRIEQQESLGTGNPNGQLLETGIAGETQAKNKTKGVE